MTTLEDDLRAALRGHARTLRVPDRPALDADAELGARGPNWRWLSAAACVVLIAAGVAVLLWRGRGEVDPSVPVDSADGRTTVVADGANLHIVGIGGLAGQTLTVHAVELDGETSGELRVGNVVVAVQCAGARPSTGARLNGRDVIIGGQVTANPDRLATVDNVHVAVGNFIALVIREGGPDGQNVTLYDPALWYGDQAATYSGSCADVVGSVPSNLDGGAFNNTIDGGVRIETA